MENATTSNVDRREGGHGLIGMGRHPALEHGAMGLQRLEGELMLQPEREKQRESSRQDGQRQEAARGGFRRLRPWHFGNIVLHISPLLWMVSPCHIYFMPHRHRRVTIRAYRGPG